MAFAQLHSAFLPPPVITDPHWVPTSYVSPCFAHIQSDTTARCLSKTQVALHLQKALLEKQALDAKQKEDGWEKRRAELEDQLRQLRVRNMEAERLFKIREKDLQDQLARLQDKLNELEQEHKKLKSANSAESGNLRENLRKLQLHCDELEHERQALKRMLADAEVTAAAREAAEKKVGELERAIEDMKARTERVMADLNRKKQEAETLRDLFWHDLTGAQQKLQQEEAARKAADEAEHLMRLDWHRMEAALRLERLINEPLRHTNHTTTTTAHVLSSYAGPVVAQRCSSPNSCRPSWPAPDNKAAAAATQADTQPESAAQGEGDEPWSDYLDQGQEPSPPGLHASSFLVPELEAAEAFDRKAKLPHQPALDRLKHNDLTRLSRAWATTTPTAGFPHTQFLDNEARFKKSYKACRKGSARRKGMPKSSKAIQEAYYDGSAVPQGDTSKQWLP